MASTAISGFVTITAPPQPKMSQVYTTRVSVAFSTTQAVALSSRQYVQMSPCHAEARASFTIRRHLL